MCQKRISQQYWNKYTDKFGILREKFISIHDQRISINGSSRESPMFSSELLALFPCESRDSVLLSSGVFYRLHASMARRTTRAWAKFDPQTPGWQLCMLNGRKFRIYLSTTRGWYLVIEVWCPGVLFLKLCTEYLLKPALNSAKTKITYPKKCFDL